MRTLVNSICRHYKRGWAEECAAELVEAAFVVPLLLTLLIGMFWAGRAYNIWETITRAAREGARVAVTPTCATCGNTFPNNTTIQNAVNSSLLDSNLDPNVPGISISIQQHQLLNLDPNNPTAQWTVISISYPFQFNLPFTSLNMTTINIYSHVQMLEEQ